jgi:hypothetical protein
MIHGFRKEDGKLYRQSIWLTTTKRPFPALLTLQKGTSFKLSPIGKEMNAKNFEIPFKYIAVLGPDCEYFIKNDIALWKKVCSNGLFDIWDPRGGPCKLFTQAAISKTAEFRIQLLRICEIDHEFSKDDIMFSTNSRNAPKLISPTREVEIKSPVISDDEFDVLRDRLERSVYTYRIPPPTPAVSLSARAQFVTEATTCEDIKEQDELLPLIKQQSRDKLIDELKAIKPTTPEQIIISGKQYKRDNKSIVAIKILKDFKCQICGASILKKDGSLYVEAAHITGKKHKGPETHDNILILCPNHHKEFDLGKKKIIERAKDKIIFELNDRKYELSLELK